MSNPTTLLNSVLHSQTENWILEWGEKKQTQTKTTNTHNLLLT